jgi:hypothetical protein
MVRIDCGICAVVDSGTGVLSIDGFARGKMLFCISDKSGLTLGMLWGRNQKEIRFGALEYGSSP